VARHQRPVQALDFGEVNFRRLFDQAALRVRRELIEEGEDLTLTGALKGSDDLSGVLQDGNCSGRVMAGSILKPGKSLVLESKDGLARSGIAHPIANHLLDEVAIRPQPRENPFLLLQTGLRLGQPEPDFRLGVLQLPVLRPLLQQEDARAQTQPGQQYDIEGGDETVGIHSRPSINGLPGAGVKEI
jgi:hypothetical protein